MPPPPPAPGSHGIVRATALVTLGVGIGVAAAIPFGGGTAFPAIVAIVVTSAAAAALFLRPRSAAAIVVADILVGLAVIATVFGRLGLLYLPLMLAFLALTARLDRTSEPVDAGADLTWEPAPEFERAMAPAIAAPTRPTGRAGLDTPTAGSIEATLETPFAEPTTAPPEAPTAEPLPAAARAHVVVHLGEASGEVSPPARHTARHLAPSPARRVAAAAARAGNRLGDRARAGVVKLRSALTAEPDVEPPDPATPDDEPEPPEQRLAVAPRSDLDDLRHEFEERELDLVAAGKPWTSLTHRAYGELRFLPAPPPPPRHQQHIVDIDDANWEAPTWKTLGEP